jgi:hypothetical protein
VTIAFHDSEANHDVSFIGQVTRITFGKEQYQWHADRKKGHADPDGPPKASTLQARQDTNYDLPAASVTVLRGAIGPLEH